MKKSTIQNIIKDIMWSEHDKDPSKPIIFPKYVIYGKNKEIFINSLDYKIEYDDYVKGTHRKTKQEIFLKYDSITKISELKFFEEYSTIIKTMDVVQPQQYQEIILDTPFEFEVYSESTDDLEIYCGDEFLGTFAFVDGVAQGTLTISNSYGKNRLLFVSGNYMDSVIVYVFATDVVKGVPPLIMENAKAGNLIYCIAYGGLEQNGTPTPDNPIPLICNNGEIKVDSNGNVYCNGLQETLRIVESNSTATTEMLLKLGDYVDSQDILNGIVNRRLGVLVLNGSETLYAGNGYIKSDAFDAYYRISGYSQFPLVGRMLNKCTHLRPSTALIMTAVGFPNTTTFRHLENNNYGQIHFNVANDIIGITDYTQETQESAILKMQQWLSEQYNNGTPVIVIYPLANSTETTVAIQSMLTVEGDNTLEIQQSSISNLEVEAEYVITND